MDRGRNSLEVICLLLSLKVAYPNSVFLVRGNHETAPINRKYGFYSEIRRRFKSKDYEAIYKKLNQCFDYIPIAAIVNKEIYCCHGGIGPGLVKLSQINQLIRPRQIPDEGFENDILWSGCIICS